MTADTSRRLSSIDLLDEDERACLDEWGHRAVLTGPASPPVPIPVLFAARVVGTYLDCPIIGIQRVPQDDETEPRSIREMAKNYADRIQGIDPTGPYNILGWSFGGVVAHEVAIELQRRGGTIAHLILLDAQPSTDEIVAPDLVESQVLEEVLRFYRVDVPEHDEPLAYQQIEELVRERGAVEFPRYKEYLDLIIQSLNSSMEMHQAHEPGVFDGDVIIFSALWDENDDYPPPSQSWRPYVTGDITEHPVPCAHKDMLTAESVSLYGPQLKNSLET